MCVCVYVYLYIACDVCIVCVCRESHILDTYSMTNIIVDNDLWNEQNWPLEYMNLHSDNDI